MPFLYQNSKIKGKITNILYKIEKNCRLTELLCYSKYNEI